MNIRPVTPSDKEAIKALWTEFVAEVPEPEGLRAGRVGRRVV